MAESYNVPYVNVRVPRNPMNVQVKQVLAHEVHILLSMFPDTTVLGPAKDAEGRALTRTVDRMDEYNRLAQAYGKNSEADSPRVEEVFGPSFGQGWKGALEAGLSLFEAPEEQAPKPPQSSKMDRLVVVVRQMLQEDPQKENEKYWMKDGAPELRELRNRMAGESVTDAERYQCYEIVQAEEAGDQGGGASQINKEAVMAQLDDLDVPYDSTEDPVALLNKLHDATIAGIKALGGTVDDSASLPQLSEQLQELRLQQE